MGHQKQEPQDLQSEKMDVDTKAIAKPRVEEMAVEEESSKQETGELNSTLSSDGTIQYS